MRERIRPGYDAVVDLFPPKRPSEFVYTLVKRCWDVSTGVCRLVEADPLLHDIRDPATEYPFMPGSDFRFYKARTDVVILGSAYAPGGLPVHSMQVRALVDGRDVRVRVTGRRELGWDREGRPVIGAPEPFTEVPLRWENAYGGADQRVPVDPPLETIEEQARLDFDHPGVYPRNPYGKGYVVLPDPIEGVELPNLEDPDHLLTSSNVIVHDPARWYLQPRPRAFHWMQPLMFPRYVFMGMDAWFPGPEDDQMPEVAEGYLERGYRQAYVEGTPVSLPLVPFFQEACPHLVFDHLEAGTPVLIQGMSPDGRDLSFQIPPPPRIDIHVEGTVETVEGRLFNVLIEPDRQQVSLTYSAIRRDLPRRFVAGVHGHIPVAAQVDGDEPVVYETPPTMRSRLEAAQASDGETPGTSSGEAAEDRRPD
jgi:hypothetical protein